MLESGRAAAADGLASQGLRDSIDSGDCWQLHGLAQAQLGNWELAQRGLETANTLIPLSPDAQYVLAMCYLREDRPELALLMLRHLAERRRSCPERLLPQIAAALGSAEVYDAAFEVCREAWRRNPREPEVLFAMAYYMRRLGCRTEHLLPVLSKAHRLARENITYGLALAAVLSSLGRREEAYDLLEDASPDQVRCPRCLARMAALFQAGREREAGCLLKRARNGVSNPRKDG